MPKWKNLLANLRVMPVQEFVITIVISKIITFRTISHAPVRFEDWYFYPKSVSDYTNYYSCTNIQSYHFTPSLPTFNKKEFFNTICWVIFVNLFICFKGSRDSSVIIATVYGLDDPGSIPGSARFFSSPQRPDWLLARPILLSNGYRGHFPGSKAARGWSWPLTSICC
jgi:hypothetical protein